MIGSYYKLTDEQRRLFLTYMQSITPPPTPGKTQVLTPEQQAAFVWDGSAAAANYGLSGGILSQSQLTTFLGVTSMLESRGVIGEVKSITAINGDIPKHEFRLIGELKNNTTSVAAINKAFPNAIGGKGHEPYTVSMREQGLMGQPNGQTSRIPNGTGIDTDVDYRALRRFKDHNTRENSDIRADDGDTSHYRRHVAQYGPIRALIPVNTTFKKSK